MDTFVWEKVSGDNILLYQFSVGLLMNPQS